MNLLDYIGCLASRFGGPLLVSRQDSRRFSHASHAPGGGSMFETMIPEHDYPCAGALLHLQHLPPKSTWLCILIRTCKSHIKLGIHVVDTTGQQGV